MVNSILEILQPNAVQSKMAILNIIKYPNLFLQKKANSVKAIDESLNKLINDMADTLYSSTGVALSAPQVGFSLRLFIYDPMRDKENRNYNTVINPLILCQSGKLLSENEGCLSVINFRENVGRYAEIVIEGLNRDGNSVHIEADGILSLILQHEIDHLDGILFIDRISKLKRDIFKKKFKKGTKKN